MRRLGGEYVKIAEELKLDYFEFNKNLSTNIPSINEVFEHGYAYFISGGNQVIKRWQTNTREILQEISVPFSPTGIFDLWLTSVAISGT